MWHMWTRAESKTFMELKPTQEVEGIEPGKISIELTGSGAGDQYLFQGQVDLGRGEQLYNLGIYSLGPMWTVHQINLPHGQLLNKEELRAGRELARKLTQTLPQIENLGSRHTKEWLQQAWDNSETRSFDEHLQELIQNRLIQESLERRIQKERE